VVQRHARAHRTLDVLTDHGADQAGPGGELRLDGAVHVPDRDRAEDQSARHDEQGGERGETARDGAGERAGRGLLDQDRGP
jgi:hypothetical protein